MQNLLKIGTSGIALPIPISQFPEEYQTGSRLQYYSSLFNTIEINSSFYKIPKKSTFEKWVLEVPDDFRFTVKLWKGITHNKKLGFLRSDVETFMHSADSIGNKKGCLLIQFPASIQFEHISQLDILLEIIQENNGDGAWSLAIEFRHTSWYNQDLYQLLQKHQASIVMHDYKTTISLLDIDFNNHFYLRFHGPESNYRGSYSDQVLKKYSYHIKTWLKMNKPVWVYFNNTMGGAFHNAGLLQNLVQSEDFELSI